MFKEAFLNHPNEHNMTYLEHLNRSLNFSIDFGVASIKALFHAFFPFLFQTSSTDLIRELYEMEHLVKIE